MFSDDLSYNKFATQSHSYNDTIYEAGNAVDRNSLTCMRTREIGTTSIHKTVWWKVDLGGMYSIYNIDVLFKNYGSWEGWGTRSLKNEYKMSDTCITNINMTTCCYMYVLGSILDIVNKVVHKQVNRIIWDFFSLIADMKIVKGFCSFVKILKLEQ